MYRMAQKPGPLHLNAHLFITPEPIACFGTVQHSFVLNTYMNSICINIISYHKEATLGEIQPSDF